MSGSKDNVVKAVLFDDKEVLLDKQTFMVGGSWDSRGMAPSHRFSDGRPVAWEYWLIKIFLNRASHIPSPVLVDVGASSGSYCLLGKYNPKMLCYAFEPNPDVFSILKKNISLNNLQDRVKAYQVALGDKENHSTLWVDKKSMSEGQATLAIPQSDKEKYIKIPVTIRILDNIVDEEGIKKVDLLKVDAEGYELFVLKGAEKTIKAYHPDILVEIACFKKFGYETHEIVDLIASWNYKNYLRADRANYYFSIHEIEAKGESPYQVELL